jgi:hypothetical protein
MADGKHISKKSGFLTKKVEVFASKSRRRGGEPGMAAI